MSEILSLWRSPLDKVAIAGAEALQDRQPRGQIVKYEDFSPMTIYNYFFYVHQQGTDDLALTAMFAAINPNLYGNFGGVAFIPQQTFHVDATASGFAVPDQCDILGSGGGGPSTHMGGSTFYHFDISGTGGSGPGYIFFNCSGSYTSGGKYFRSLAFHWNGSSNAADTCISAATWNCRAINCTFTDCPVSFNATGEACAIEQCTIQYTTQTPGGTTAVILAGLNCAILGPSVLEQKGGANGPANCTGVSVRGPAEHAVIADAHISEWNIGVDFSLVAGSQYTHIRNCEAQCVKNALNIQLPQNAAGATTAGIKAIGCIFAKSGSSTDASPVVNIDAQLISGHNTNNQLYDINLVDCTVFSQASAQLSGQHGLEIIGGTNIKIIGGTYSNNGSGGGAGIAITGPCGDVQVIGANLQPNYPKSATVYNQTYAVLITGGPVGTVLISGCDMSGYPGTPPKPVSVSGTAPNELLIYNCPGYNDQNTPLNNGVAPTGSAISAATCTTPYFGPSIITFTSGIVPSTLHIFGQILTLSIGIIFLPSPYDGFYFSTRPQSFSWIGK